MNAKALKAGQPTHAERVRGQILKEAAERNDSGSIEGTRMKDERFQTLFRSRPDVMEMLIKTGRRSVAEINPMIDNVDTMTVDVLSECADHFHLPFDVLVYGEAHVDFDALAEAVAVTFGDDLLKKTPAVVGAKISESGSDLCNRQTRDAWRIALSSHLAGTIGHFYKRALIARLEGSDAE